VSRPTVGDRLVDAAYATGWAAVRGLPERVARRQFDALADAVWLRRGKGVQRLEANLRRVLGPDVDDRALRKVTHLGVRSYLRYWCEVFQLPRIPLQSLVERMQCIDEQRLRAGAASGRGMILVLPHMGNWDHAGAWLAGTGVPFTTVAERLEPASLFERFVAFRESLGMEVIPLTGGERAPLDVLAERLGQGWVVALLGDRDLSRNGIEVSFFGGRTRMPAGPAILAIRTNAPLYAVDLSFTPTRTHAVLRRITPPTDGPLDVRVRQTTQALADAYAIGIADHPQDWHMLQKLWL